MKTSRTLFLVLGVTLGVAAGLALWPRGAERDAAPPVRDVAVTDAAPEGADGGEAASGSASAGRSGPRESRLPFRLLATVVRENPALSIATLEGVDGGGYQVLSEGDAIAGHARARVARIERARILLDNDGVREQLRIDWGERTPAVAAAGRPPAPAPPRPRAAPAPEPELEPDGDVFAEGELRGVYRDGELVGIRVEAIRAGGLYERFGLRDGDLLLSVNGVSLDSPTAAVQLLRELAAAEWLDVDVERRDGSETVVSMPTDELGEALRRLP